jgi:hypothetical protein
MKKRLLLTAAILALAIPLVYLLKDMAQQFFAIEILRLAWTVRILFESLPQTRLWAAFLAVALFLAARSLIEHRTPRQQEPDLETEQLGQVAVVTGWIQRSWSLAYSRRSLARSMRALTLEVLAYQHRSTPEQIRQELRTGRLEVPPEIQAYLDLGRSPVYTPPTSLLARFRRRLWSSVRAPQVDPELERVVHFLESQLEIDHQPENRSPWEVQRDG